jgi:hypothetical protein
MFSDNKNLNYIITNNYDSIIKEYDESCLNSYTIVNWVGTDGTAYDKIVKVSVMSDGTRTFRPGIMRLMNDEYFEKLLPPLYKIYVQ